jgi:transcriptional regulator with GAF, ATPase, and Fis domain
VTGIRSVLWIGRGEHFPAGSVAEATAFDVVWERDVVRAARLSPESFHAVVLDAEDADQAREGLRALELPASIPVLVRIDRCDEAHIAGLHGDGASEVVQRESGATLDLLPRLERLVRQAAERRSATRLVPAPARRAADQGLIGEGPEMQQVYGLLAVASRSRATVLLQGETGTGKELVARAIHRGSQRRRAAFVAINCAAFPDTLLESELFGHQRGAFTGAERDKPGLFETADAGTLFLDEVGETSAPFQAKLLRVLQEREVRRLGGTRPRRVDVRVIAASNRDLRADAQRAAFRADLYYRLAVFPIHLPPLRNRPSDVIPLARHFLTVHGRAENKADLQLSHEAQRLLQAYSWPGNVRELENEVQRALALAEGGDSLSASHFSERLSGILEPVEATFRAGETLRDTLGRIEAWLIRRALDTHGGRRAATARRLGITREGLYKKMKRLGIE